MTAVTAAVPPALAPTRPGAVGTDTVTWAQFTQSINQAQRTGLCVRPIRLRGQIAAIDLATGELRPLYDTATDEPGGVLHVPCGNRRETACPPCSTVYKRDARQLVRAGLTGGKGVPETISGHPCVFATFTAPSFGPVHARRMRGKTVLPCRPRRDHKVRRCPHGRDISCPVRHHDKDPRLGRALCPDCYDYQAAVLFNAHSGVLWRRFTTYLPRHLARLTGLTQQRLRALARVRYVKVAEYQARGVIHFHAVIRLDAPGDDYQPPPAQFTTTLLCDAIHQAAAAVTITVGPDIHPVWPALTLRFGAQIDTKPIARGDGLPGTGHKLSVQAVGNYIAKYATKALDAPGLPQQPLRSSQDIAALRCHGHYRAMITTAWELGGGKLAPARTRLCKWAHALGHGGHFLTKSRRYSVTFGQLRRARTEHRKQQHHSDGQRDPWGRPIDETTVLIVENWAYHGTGYATTPATELALAAAARARDHERAGIAA
jgi:hypothetical protein